MLDAFRRQDNARAVQRASPRSGVCLLCLYQVSTESISPAPPLLLFVISFIIHSYSSAGGGGGAASVARPGYVSTRAAN